MTVIAMIKEQLQKLKADGLANVECECGCHISDLCPCDEVNLRECVAARWISCIECDSYGSCEFQDSRGDIEGFFLPIHPVKCEERPQNDDK